MQGMGYAAMPGYASWYGGPYISQIRGPLECVAGNGKRTLRTVMFSGHAGADGNVLLLGGPDEVNPPAGAQWYIVSNTAYYDSNPMPQINLHAENCLVLDTVASGPGGAGSFANLDLVLLCGCFQANAPALADAFLNGGAGAVVRVGGPDQVGNAVSIWLDGPLIAGDPDMPDGGFYQLLAKESIQAAVNQTNTDYERYYHDHPDSPFVTPVPSAAAGPRIAEQLVATVP